jgi:hypothetical protein
MIARDEQEKPTRLAHSLGLGGFPAAVPSNSYHVALKADRANGYGYAGDVINQATEAGSDKERG